MPQPVLEFTGERFTPECVREIWYEHVHRYAFAAPLARGCRVLDAACGEGYGSALLARSASSVLGLDLSKQAVEHASERYRQQGNLRFAQADVSALDDYPAASFDLIVSFETLEHVNAQEAMLDGFQRLLAADGLLLISTPDKHTYSDLSGFRNEFHTRELYREEFDAMLAARFSHRRLLGQKLLFQSVLWDAQRQQRWAASTLDDGLATPALDYAPLYWVAACSRDARRLDELPDLHLFGDHAESVYAHYNAEVRKNMAAGQRILELENALAAAQAQLAQWAPSTD